MRERCAEQQRAAYAVSGVRACVRACVLDSCVPMGEEVYLSNVECSVRIFLQAFVDRLVATVRQLVPHLRVNIRRVGGGGGWWLPRKHTSFHQHRRKWTVAGNIALQGRNTKYLRGGEYCSAARTCEYVTMKPASWCECGSKTMSSSCCGGAANVACAAPTKRATAMPPASIREGGRTHSRVWWN